MVMKGQRSSKHGNPASTLAKDQTQRIRSKGSDSKEQDKVGGGPKRVFFTRRLKSCSFSNVVGVQAINM